MNNNKGIVPAKDLFVDPFYFCKKSCLVVNTDVAVSSMLSEMSIDYHAINEGNSSSFPETHVKGMITDDMIAEVDFVLLTGGTDISPAIYHQERGSFTDIPDSTRDHTEVSLIKKCMVLGVPIVGICRGAQLISSVYGGHLVQHDTTKNHLGSHDLLLSSGFIMENCYANHHQTIIAPPESNVLAEHNNVQEIIRHGSKGLSVQYHPEWHHASDRQRLYFYRLIHDLLES